MHHDHTTTSFTFKPTTPNPTNHSYKTQQKTLMLASTNLTPECS